MSEILKNKQFENILVTKFILKEHNILCNSFTNELVNFFSNCNEHTNINYYNLISSESPVILMDFLVEYDDFKPIDNYLFLSIETLPLAIIYIGETNEKENLLDYQEELLGGLDYLARKYKYTDLLGRGSKRKYDVPIFALTNSDDDDDSIHILNINNIKAMIDILFAYVNKNNKNTNRSIRGLRSLLLGSINKSEIFKEDIPSNIIQKLEYYINMYDKEQFDFLVEEDKLYTVVQGIAGTGKSYLLLHKLIRTYDRNSSLSLAITCFNHVLADDFSKKIVSLSNMLKLEKQINWDNIDVGVAWSGIYKNITKYYNLSYYSFKSGLSFELICKKAIEELTTLKNQNTKFDILYDYIFIDEAQDLADTFIDMCRMVSRKVFVAQDVLQNIFGVNSFRKANYPLYYCYRTPVELLMLGHSVLMGLQDSEKISWMDDWASIGYDTELFDKNKIKLSRRKVSKFEEINDIDPLQVIDIGNSNVVDMLYNVVYGIVKNETYEILKNKLLHKICIICDYSYQNYLNIYSKLSDKLSLSNIALNILSSSGEVIENEVCFTNTNNVKGLEFAFVIYVDMLDGGNITSSKERARFYMSITRAMLSCYILTKTPDYYLNKYKAIKNKGYIETDIPSEDEKNNIAKKEKFISNMSDAEEQLLNLIKNKFNNKYEISEQNIHRIYIAVNQILKDTNKGKEIEMSVFCYNYNDKNQIKVLEQAIELVLK